MDLPGLLYLFDQDQRISVEYPDLKKEMLPRVVRFLRPGPGGGGHISYAWVDEFNAGETIAEQVEFFTELNAPLDWLVCSHDPYPGIKDQLLAAGFQSDLDPGDPGAVLALDLQEAPAELRSPVTQDVRPVTQPEDLRDVIRVLETVYGRDFGWVQSRMGANLAIPGYLSTYLAYAAGEPASVGWTYYPPGSPWGSLYGGSTVPQMRQRGLYTAVLAARVQDAIRRGRRYLVVYAGLESRPILERHGFRLLTYACSYEWKPGGKEG